MKLTDKEIRELVKYLKAGEPIPQNWRSKLFADSGRALELGKEYRLVYDGKMRREEVLAQTPAAPWQLVRRFCTERPHPDGWRASDLVESKKTISRGSCKSFQNQKIDEASCLVTS
jgi:hypothetical protein